MKPLHPNPTERCQISTIDVALQSEMPNAGRVVLVRNGADWRSRICGQASSRYQETALDRPRCIPQLTPQLDS